MAKYVGQNIPRKDGFDKVTGIGAYTHDVQLPRMLHAKVLRSPFEHAFIKSIDTGKAEALAGVYAVATYKNTPQILYNTSATMITTNPGHEPVLDQVTFGQEVRYIGDEVAAVAATTEEIAKQALKLIEVEYEELPSVVDHIEAMKADAPNVHENLAEKNICGGAVEFGIGDVEKGLAEGEVITEATITLPRVKQAQLETHGAVADFRGDGTLTVYATTQTPHPTKMILAYALDMAESKIRVLNPPYVGGGFGVRIGLSGKAEIIAALLSKLAKRPVKCEYTREEDFIASDTRHGGTIKVKLAAKKDGTFVALDTYATFNTGAYATFGVELMGVTGACGTAGTYRIPNMHYKGFAVYTNQQTAGAFRGFGTPQGSLAVETAVDEMAKKLNMDPIELRLKNITQEGDQWWFPYPVGKTALKDCIEAAANAIGWKEKRGKKQTGVIRRGVGIGCGTHVSNAAPFCVDYDSIYIRVEQDGSLHIASGMPEIGPGSSTGLLQIAADAMGIPMENIHLEYGDTASSPFDIGSHASRTLYAVGNVIISASKKLKADILSWAGEFLGVDASKLILEDGVVKGDGKEITMKKLAYEAHLRGKQFIISDNQVPPNSPPWHADTAEVEVDMETGMVKILKVVAAHDIGTVVNPILAEGQIEGGVMQGIGWST
ncbi:MAG: molybdopterin cofactor-binding domain-containing protein, partial [Oscillospiraceae bacterium]